MLKKILSKSTLLFCLIFVLFSSGDSSPAKASQLQSESKDIVIYVDFRLPSTQKRMTIMQGNRVIYKTWVAHGSGSGKGIYAVKFSNENNSHASSLGHYRLSYRYNGHNGVSIRLIGLDRSNNNAYNRMILIHSASYIGYGKVGNSWGCFAVPPDAMQFILQHYSNIVELIAYK